jgi:hypothetical protein
MEFLDTNVDAKASADVYGVLAIRVRRLYPCCGLTRILSQPPRADIHRRDVFEREQDNRAHRDDHEHDFENIPEREPYSIEFLFGGQPHNNGFATARPYPVFCSLPWWPAVLTRLLEARCDCVREAVAFCHADV